MFKLLKAEHPRKIHFLRSIKNTLILDSLQSLSSILIELASFLPFL